MYDREKYLRNKETHRKSWEKRSSRNREWSDRDKMERGCLWCGYRKYARALHYHHHNNDKEQCVSRLCSQGSSLDRVMKEAEKCIGLCANCHAEAH
jgi:hypothetical protein